jgi:hypothetical protein
MNSKKLSRFVFVTVLAMAVGSCSYAYEITAVARNGALAFTIGGSGLFGGRTPYVQYVMVDAVGKPNKPVWKLETQVTNGIEMHEVSYGKAPANMKTTVGPSPLIVGQLYRAQFFTGDGGGFREFAISDDGVLLNMRP